MNTDDLNTDDVSTDSADSVTENADAERDAAPFMLDGGPSGALDGPAVVTF